MSSCWIRTGSSSWRRRPENMAIEMVDSLNEGSYPRLLVFCAGSLLFGADADKIDSLDPFDPDDPPRHAVPFHQAIGLGCSPPFRFPEVCTISRGKDVCRLIIEAPEDIICADTRLLQPLPPLVAPFALRRGIWAALPGKRGILLALDPRRLATERNLWHTQGDIA